MKEEVRNKSVKKDSKKKKWKKVLAISGIVLAVLLIFLHVGLGFVVKAAVSKIGPMITGTEMTLQSAAVYPILGYVKLEGFSLKNPAGYQQPYAVTVRKLVVDINTFTIFSAKKILDEFTLSGVDIYYEQGLKSNNLSDICNQLDSISSKQKEAVVPVQESAAKPLKLQVDRLRINDINLNMVITVPGMAKSASAPLAMVPISLNGLGTGNDGITFSDLFKVIMMNLISGASSSVSEAFGSAANNTAEVLKELDNRLRFEGKKTFEKTNKLFRKMLPSSLKK